MKRLAAGILAGFLLSSSGVMAQTAPAQDGNVVRETLANGLRVVIVRDRLAPVATTNISYGVGSDDDTMPGIAHATEHMMFRGTHDVTPGQFTIMTARAGAQYNAGTGNYATQYYFKLPSMYVGLALRLEADRMTGARELASDWNTERGAIEQEVRAHESVPTAKVLGKMRRAVFGDTPYAQDGVGTVASFEKMRASDIAQFYHTWYHPNNATLIVTGYVDPTQILAQIHRYFDPIPSVPLPQHHSYAFGALDASTLRDTIAELPVPVVAETYRMPALGAPDYMAGQILSLVLNNVRGGFGQLQTKGQILGAGAVAGAYSDVGTMIVVGFGLPGTQPEGTQSAIDGVLETYRTGGVPSDLIETAKLRMLSQQQYQRSSISGLADWWSNALSLGYDSPDDILSKVAAVTPADVDRVFRQYIDPKHAVSMLLQPKSVTSLPHVDPNANKEDVQYPVDKDEPLPPWAKAYFTAPLTVPAEDGAASAFTLPNGLRLTVQREPFAPTVALEGTIRMSSQLYEPKGKDGVSDITATLLQWGTSTYDRAAFQAQLDAIASSVSLGSSFGLESQSANLDRSLQLLADGMLHPAFADASFEVVKGNTERTLAAVEHLPSTQAAIAQTNALYPIGDPRRRRATAATVASVTLQDVKKWYAFAYRPDLTTIAIVGDVSPAEAKAAVERYFGQWHAHGPRPPFIFPRLKSHASRSVTVTSSTSTQSQVTLTQIINVHRGDPDYIPLQLADTILSGEGTGSMLFQDLREKNGYVYDVSSEMDIGLSSSTFSIDFASDPKNVERAQAAAVADIRRLQTALIPTEQLQRAKALLLAERVLPLDSYEGIAGDILEAARSGISSAEDAAFWNALLHTTPDQVRAAMRRWVKPEGFTRVMVAPGS
ncbi:MAG TPA: pitrilysin family protein [Candidatus Baltobacteraceae bacterium]|nr:pitrilysin family protein [Candidatus Baltobacteraceae bacterium]